MVIAIIGILIGLLLPKQPSMPREAGRRVKCQNISSKWCLAVLNYNDNFGHFPEGT